MARVSPQNHSPIQSINMEQYAVTPSFLGPLAVKRLADSASGPRSIDSPETLLVSPYIEDEHLLYLDSVEPQCQLLAKALVTMKAERQDYATAPYIDTFNWPEIIKHLLQHAESSQVQWQEQVFYVVVFRSQIPPTTNYANLGELDKAAHAEATKSGGFLKYWFGSPDHTGRNMATCVWRSKEDARLGGVGLAHRQAAMAARHLYTDWEIERLALVIKDDIKEWKIRPWVD